MHKIVPHLWFDTQAKEAAAFYTTVFDNSRVLNTVRITDTPSGDCDVVTFEVRGRTFQAISAGPLFKINPSISFFVNYDPSRESDADKRIDADWKKLADGGRVLMALQEYPWSRRYGWVQDKYGVTWQLILTNPEGEERPEIMPALLFTGGKYGKAEEAIKFYLSVFEESKPGAMTKYPAGMEPNKEGTVMFADFKLLDTWLAAMDGPGEHDFTFNEGVSIIVHCDDQAEIDHYWKKLSAVREAEQCGWLKDKYGVSWQIVPTAMEDMLMSGDRAAIDRVVQAFLPMKKFIIADLEKAYKGEAVPH